MGSKGLLKYFFKLMTATNHSFFTSTPSVVAFLSHAAAWKQFAASVTSCSVLWLLSKALVKHLDLPGESFSV